MTTRDERIKAASQERRVQRKAQLRAEILDAARDLFVTHGYEQFSLRQVAERIGYSPTTIYLHFDDKEDLLFHICIGGFAAFGQALKDADAPSAEPISRVIELGYGYVRFGLAHPLEYRLMFMLRPEFLQRRPAANVPPPIDSFGLLQNAVENAMSADALPKIEPLHLANALWSAVHGIVALRLSQPIDDDEALRMVELVLPALMRGLASATS